MYRYKYGHKRQKSPLIMRISPPQLDLGLIVFLIVLFFSLKSYFDKS